MAATARTDFLPRSIMTLCLVAAVLVVGVQVRAWINTLAQPRSDLEPTSGTLPPIPANSPRVVVDLGDRRVSVYSHRKKLLVEYPLAIGQEGWETPKGSFRIFQKKRNPKWMHPITRNVVPPGPENPLGRHWIGFAGDQRLQFGFHGTTNEQLIGQAVSHGCLRMRNVDISALFEYVDIGTPVEVRP